MTLDARDGSLSLISARPPISSSNGSRGTVPQRAREIDATDTFELDVRVQIETVVAVESSQQSIEDIEDVKEKAYSDRKLEDGEASQRWGY